MRTTVLVATLLTGTLLALAADTTSSGQPPAKKKTTASKATTKSHTTASHTATSPHTTTASHTASTSHSGSHPATASNRTTSGTRKTASKKGKKGASHPVVPARARQASPTPERYQEIQQALVSKGYLPADQANGQWNDGSTAALKRFQADQKLDATGKINSLSLIALGLGPKHETPKPVGTPAAPPAAPQQP